MCCARSSSAHLWKERKPLAAGIHSLTRLWVRSLAAPILPFRMECSRCVQSLSLCAAFKGIPTCRILVTSATLATQISDFNSLRLRF